VIPPARVPLSVPTTALPSRGCLSLRAQYGSPMKRASNASLRLVSRSLLALSLAACGSPPPTQAPGAEGIAPEAVGTAAGAPAPVATPASDAPGQAHALFLEAAGCWFGGLWSDAEGGTPDVRRAAGEKRCLGLVTRLYGSEDKVKYDQLRLVDPAVVDRIAAEVERLASRDPVDGAHKGELVRLLRALAAAQRENDDAHIAADTVKSDLKNGSEPVTLSKDEVAAVKPLRAHAGLEALLKLDAGDLTAEAHAMGLLAAMDRMELARGMPKHLKVYAVSDAYQLVFGVAPPSVPVDPTAKLVPGTWLAYVTDVARAAGHAVPDAATLPREREPWAWGGVIAGFADKLRADTAKLAKDGAFARVAGFVVKKLDAEWAEIPQVAAGQKAMAEREAKEKKK
jgi:hypothetical protein